MTVRVPIRIGSARISAAATACTAWAKASIEMPNGRHAAHAAKVFSTLPGPSRGNAIRVPSMLKALPWS